MEEYFVNETRSLWKSSLAEMKRVKSICIAAMMMALNTLLGYLSIIVIPKLLTISFASLALGACAMCCGPLLTAVMAAIADILKYILRPNGAFFLGCLFYRKAQISLKRCIFARLLIVILINLILTPLWLYILYGNSFWAMLGLRLAKNALMFPIDVALLYLVTKTTGRILKQMNYFH